MHFSAAAAQCSFGASTRTLILDDATKVEELVDGWRTSRMAPPRGPPSFRSSSRMQACRL